MPWFDNIPVCFNCGVPCPECRHELSKDLPMELSTSHALLDSEEIHKEVDDGNEGRSKNSNRGLETRRASNKKND